MELVFLEYLTYGSVAKKASVGTRIRTNQQLFSTLIKIATEKLLLTALSVDAQKIVSRGYYYL